MMPVILFLLYAHPKQMADASYYGGASTAKPTMDQGKIFVGGLSWQTTEESLRWHFMQFGQVLSVEGAY
jgi:RNA recognition motif-containing protein